SGLCAFIEELGSVLGKWLVKLRSPQLPHLLHRLLSRWTELHSTSPFVERGTEASDDVLDLRFRENADTRLHKQVLVKKEHLSADTCVIRRRIIGSGQLTQQIARRSFKAGTQQAGQLATESKILCLRQALHDPTVAPQQPLCRWRDTCTYCCWRVC